LPASRRPPTPSHAFFVPGVVQLFEELDIGVSLLHADDWVAIHQPREPSLVSFELEHGAETERFAYNWRCIALARRRAATVVGEHGGFTDLFVPIPSSGRIDSILVSGPLATERATSAALLERWRALTGRQGHPADPEFSQYMAMVLSTLVLERPRVAKYGRLLECLAQLMAARGSSVAIQREIQSLRTELLVARAVERSWKEASTLVDARTSRVLASRHSAVRLRTLGLTRPPEQVAVGLLASRDENADPVDILVRREAFQRASVERARRTENAVSGRIGDHGVTFLCAGKSRSTAESVRQRLLELGGRASSLAERHFGLRLHLGLGAPAKPIGQQYQDALGAAESALSRGVRVEEASQESPSEIAFGRLRRELDVLAEERPKALPARFARYLEAAAARSGHRLELVRVEARAGFERIADSVLKSGALDEHNLTSFTRALERRAAEATTVGELLAMHRRALDDLLQVAARPTLGVRDRSLRSAQEHMRQHYAEPLSLSRVARIAGFSAKHFSAMFHDRQGVTFEHYLIELRIERAKQLLIATELSMQRVALLSGFSERHHFGTMFKRRVGQTPGQYRARGKATLPGARTRMR